jgi:hypothetical protein
MEYDYASELLLRLLFQEPFNHSNKFAIGFALIGAESDVFVRQVALLVDDYDRRDGVQAE